MTNEAIIRQLKEKDRRAQEEGIREIIMDFRMLLLKLKIVPLYDSNFISYQYMKKHSPLFKKKV